MTTLETAPEVTSEIVFDAEADTKPEANRMRVAICFWGICRSLKYTIESIKKNIFEPLTSFDISYDIYMHTYNVSAIYNNPLAGENDIFLDNDEYTLLDPDHLKIENQKETDKIINFSKYLTKGNPWTGYPETFNNHLRALWSLNEVTKLWVPNKDKYTHIMYCRPDVLYIQPLKYEFFVNDAINKNNVLIPYFDLYKGINDQFAIGNPYTMEIYGSRFNDAYIYSQHFPLHSESYLGAIFRKYNIYCAYILFVFKRVRANGKLEKSEPNRYPKIFREVLYSK